MSTPADDFERDALRNLMYRYSKTGNLHSLVESMGMKYLGNLEVLRGEVEDLSEALRAYEEDFQERQKILTCQADRGVAYRRACQERLQEQGLWDQAAYTSKKLMKSLEGVELPEDLMETLRGAAADWVQTPRPSDLPTQSEWWELHLAEVKAQHLTDVKEIQEEIDVLQKRYDDARKVQEFLSTLSS